LNHEEFVAKRGPQFARKMFRYVELNEGVNSQFLKTKQILRMRFKGPHAKIRLKIARWDSL